MNNKTIALIVVFIMRLTELNAQTPALVKDIVSGSGGSLPQYLTVFDNHLYFGTALTNGLWRTDGTEAGTELAEGFASIGFDSANTLGVFQNKLFFNTFSNKAWWSTSGGIDNAVKIKDQFGNLGSLAYTSTALGEEVLVLAGRDYSLPGNPSKLYRSDLTDAGTVEIGNFISDDGNVLPHLIGSVNSKLLFSAIETGQGRELFSTDATTASTGLVKDIKPGIVGGISDVSGSQAATLGSNFYFPAFPDMGQGLWKTDATTVGTVEVGGLSVAYSSPSNLNKFGSSIYFFAYGSSPPNQLFKISAGDDAPVQLTNRDLFSDEGCFSYETIVFNGYLYFPFSDNSAGCELWKTNGSILGTSMVKDINPGADIGSHPRFLAVYDGWLYFIALKEGFGFELWKTNGFEITTTMVADINPGVGSSINNTQAVEFNGELYFIADDGVHGTELFKLMNDVIFDDGFDDAGPI